jgi:hypothetical protein
LRSDPPFSLEESKSHAMALLVDFGIADRRCAAP